jgi:hypothetical protein
MTKMTSVMVRVDGSYCSRLGVRRAVLAAVVKHVHCPVLVVH